MSNDLHNSERYLKNLADKHTPTPPTFVWDDISQELDKRKDKRRALLLLWLCGALAIASIAFIYLTHKVDKSSHLAKQATIISDSPSDSNPTSQDIISIDSEVDNGEKNTIDGQVAKSPSAEINKQARSPIEPIKRESPTHQLNHSNPLHLPSLDPSSYSYTTTASAGNPTSVNEQALGSPSIVARSKATKMVNSITINQKEVAELQRLQWVRRPLAPMTSQPDFNEDLKYNTALPPKVNALIASPWFVELGAGMGSNVSNPIIVDPTLGALRLTTESGWYSWSATFQLGYQLNQHWYTTVGVDFNQTKKRFDYWRRDISRLTVGENQDLQITNSDFYNIGEIVYTFADVGLSVGRRMNIAKWHFSVEGGPIFNVLFDANGKVQVGDLAFSRLENQEGYYKSQVGIGGRLSAMIDYPISDQLWISAGPTYHQYFNPISSDENPLEEQNSIVQVKAKVRYHF